ncbi:MAG: hypothetical protein ACYDBB_13815 [Armatimonadota bacterium]
MTTPLFRGLGTCLRNLAYCFTLLLILPSAGWAQGKGNGVEVRAVFPAQFTAKPAEIVSVSYRVTNTTKNTENFAEALTLPTSWQAVMPQSEFTLNPGESTIRIIAFQVPGATPVGRYPVSYAVRSRRDYAIQDIEKIDVQVLPLTRLLLLLEEKPDSVIAGQAYQFTVRAINQGNAALQVNFAAKSLDKPYQIQVTPATTELKAGESRLITVTVQTRGDETRSFTNYLLLSATSARQTGVMASVSCGVTVYPRAGEKAQLLHTIPTRLQIRMAGREGTSNGQLAWYGAGSLDEAGGQRIDFLFQAPDTQREGFFGWRDEYRFNLSTERGDIRLGDQSYGLSYLTDFYHYGRGFAVNNHEKNGLNLGLYQVTNRWEESPEQTTGFFIQRAVSATTSLRLNILRKNQPQPEDAASSRDRIMSLEASLHPSSRMAVGLEFGRCDSDREGETVDYAYRAEVNGVLGSRVYYNIRRTHAGPNYNGYYHDSDSTRGTLSFSLGDRLQLQTSFSSWKSNLDRRAEIGAATVEQLAEFNLQYNCGRGWYLTAGVDRLRRQDISQTPRFDTLEYPIHVGIGHSADLLSWNAQLLTGSRLDNLTGKSSRAYDCRFFTSYRPNPQHYFNLYGGYGRDGQESTLLGNNNYLGVSTTWNFGTRCSVTAWYTTNNIASGQQRTDQRQLTARYQLPNTQQLAFSINQRNLQNTAGRETSYEITYTIPFDLAVSKRTSVGVVQGRVYDVRRKAGIANVVLIMHGAGAATDAEGNFTFPACRPGSYTLTVDQKSIGLHRITTETMPLTVQVTGGEVTAIDIGVTDGIKVTGSVIVLSNNPNATGSKTGEANPFTVSNTDGIYLQGNPQSDSKNVPAHGLANMLVEITNGQEIQRRVTNVDGFFTFDSLRPGKWRIKVYDYNLPVYHYLEQDEFEVELGNHPTVNAQFRVLPKLRRIIMVADANDVTPVTTKKSP